MRPPRVCVWELTLACDAACVHCGSDAGRARPRELDDVEAATLCGELAALGVKRATLSGGEPLLRTGWEGIASLLTTLGIATDIITNGLSLGEKEAGAIEAIGLRGVTVSVDGTGPVHDRLRGVRGAHARAMAALERLRRRGVKRGVATQVSRANLGELPRMEAELVEARVDGWQLQLTMPMGRCRKEDRLALEPGQTSDVIAFVAAASRRAPFPVYAADNVGWMTRDEPLIRPPGRRGPAFFRGCRAGLDVIGITSEGGVRGCLSLPPAFNEGSIRGRRLADIWNDKEAFPYNRRRGGKELTGACRACAYRRVCRGGCTCLAWASCGRISENPYCTRLHASST